MVDVTGKADESRRAQRFEKEIRSILANKIIRDFGNSLGFVTVTKVTMTKDLKVARVYISIFGEKVDKELSLESLDNHRHEFQHLLGRELKAKYVPKLEFYLDNTFEEVARIGKTLQGLKSNSAEGPVSVEGYTASSAEEDESIVDSEIQTSENNGASPVKH